MGLIKKAKKEKKETIEAAYEVEKSLLGSGQFATVHRGQPKAAGRTCLAPDGSERQVPSQVAVKNIDKSKAGASADCSKEIEVLRMASSPPHENIVQLFEVFDKPKRMYLVQELLSGGNLFERVVERSFFPERDAANTTSQICAALHHIHERGIIHRDLKPENVMYVGPELDSRVKLADFGSSVIVGRGGAKDDAGTPGYVAPEILNGEGKGEDPCVDMWACARGGDRTRHSARRVPCRLLLDSHFFNQPGSLLSCRVPSVLCSPVGVILYILLCGFPPFYEEELPALFDSIKNARYDFPRDSPWDFVSDDGLQLVTKILCLDTARRPSASQVMRHHWTVGAIAGKLPNMAAAPSKHKSVGLRVFRKAALGVIAQQRIMRAIGGGFRHGEESNMPEPRAESFTKFSQAGMGSSSGDASADDASFLSRLAKAEDRDALHEQQLREQLGLLAAAPVMALERQQSASHLAVPDLLQGACQYGSPQVVRGGA